MAVILFLEKLLDTYIVRDIDEDDENKSRVNGRISENLLFLLDFMTYVDSHVSYNTKEFINKIT